MARYCIFILLVCLNASSQSSTTGVPPSSAATAGVSGTVIDSETQKPLEAVHVVMYSDATGEVGAMTDARGRFSIPDLPAGTYAIWLEKRGFIYAPVKHFKKGVASGLIYALAGTLKLDLKAGEQPDLVMPMVAPGIISGRVLDEHGDSLIGVSVVAESYTVGLVGTRTNGRGEFRLIVPPGKFYLSSSLQGNSEYPDTPVSETGYVQTYFPGVRELQEGVQIEVSAGKPVSGVELRLLRPAAFQVSGEVTGIPAGLRVSVCWKGADHDFDRLNFVASKDSAGGAPGGVSFRSPPLRAGTYAFYAEGQKDDREFRSPETVITVSDSNIPGVALALAPGADMQGSITFAGRRTTAASTPAILSVQMSPVEGYASPRPMTQASMDGNGRFTVPNLFAGRYELAVSPLAEDQYVRRIELNGAALHGNLVDLSSGVEDARLKIAIGGHAAQIAGQVDAPGEDFATRSATVVLFPQHGEAEEVDERECLEVPVDEHGVYHFYHLAPGRYSIAARGGYTGLCAETAAEIRKGVGFNSVELKPDEKVVRNLQVRDTQKTDEASDESQL